MGEGAPKTEAELYDQLESLVMKLRFELLSTGHFKDNDTKFEELEEKHAGISGEIADRKITTKQGIAKLQDLLREIQSFTN
jgi:hypothetical protein